LNIPLRLGNVFTSDTFYDNRRCLSWNALNVLAVEMEAAGLYLNAARTGKDALCLVTITDLLDPKTEGPTKLSVIQRQESLHDMINVALEMTD
jgi:purine-nucleoside phosphorylase